jgi:hypothetical protein
MPSIAVSVATRDRIHKNTLFEVKTVLRENGVSNLIIKSDKRKRYDTDDAVINRALDALEREKKCL